MFFNVNKSRYRKVEREVDAYKQIIADKELQRSLGSRASMLLRLSDNFFVPNFRNGLVTIPKEYQESEITPILPVKQGEMLAISSDFARFSPLQRVSADEILTSHLSHENKPSIEAVESALRKENQQVNSILTTDAMVTALSDELIISTDDTDPLVFQAFFRPLVLLDTKKHLPPSVIGHELRHVVQHSEVPFEVLPERETSHKEQREVEAYLDGAVLEQSEGLGHNRQQYFVEAGRRLANFDRPIQVTDVFRSYLKNNGYEVWNE